MRSKEKRALRQLVEREGYQVESICTSKGGHIQLTLSFGPLTRKVFTSATSSDWRARRNLVRDMKRAFARPGRDETRKEK